MQKKVSKRFWENKRIILLLVIGTLSWSITMIKSGLLVGDRVGFWGANGHDGIWHMALSSALARGSIQTPVLSGFTLQNYHIGFDFILAMLFRITQIPISIWYFQVLPPLFALSIGFLTYVFIRNITASKSAAWWSTFFVYFGGSFGFVVTFLRGEGLGGESMFWSQQAVSTLINPPFALSLVVLLCALITLQKYKQRTQKILFLLIIILFASLLSIKVYAGVLALGALFVQGIYEWIRDKSYKTLIIFTCSLLLSLIIFLPLNRGAGGLVVLEPGWFLETMLALSDRFYWPKLFDAITNWKADHLYVKAIAGYIVAFAIFVVGNFGTRLFFLFLVKKRIRKFKFLQFSGTSVFFGAMLLGGVVAPMLFLQTGTAWNTIQFLYYSLFVSSLLTGIAVNSIIIGINSNRLKQILILSVVCLTVPTSYSTLRDVYIPARPPAMITKDEVEALSVLRSLPQGVVLTYPYDPILAKAAISNPPRPLYLYDSTAYVAAYGNHDVFLEDEVNLTIMNYQWKDRRRQLDEFYASTDQKKVFNFLRDNNISYIYWIKPQFTKIGDLQLNLTNIFENKTVIIYKVN